MATRVPKSGASKASSAASAPSPTTAPALAPKKAPAKAPAKTLPKALAKLPATAAPKNVAAPPAKRRRVVATSSETLSAAADAAIDAELAAAGEDAVAGASSNDGDAAAAAEAAENKRRLKSKGAGKACSSCDASHVKCSREKPSCERCVTRGHACVYESRFRGPTKRDLNFVVRAYEATCAPCAAAHRACPGVDRGVLRYELLAHMQENACTAAVASAFIVLPACTRCREKGDEERCVWSAMGGADAGAGASSGADSAAGIDEEAALLE